MKINKLSTLKQYNPDSDKMSNSIPKNINKFNYKRLNITTLLHNLSLNTTEYNKSIAKELLKDNLPFNKQTFAMINNFLQKTQNSLPATTKDKIKIAILLKKLNLPLNSKFFKLFKEYPSSHQQLNNRLNQLLEQINLKQTKETQQQNNTNSKSRKKLKAILNKIIIDHHKATPKQIKKSIKTLNFNPQQQKIINLLKELNNATKNQTKSNNKLIHQLINLKAINYETNFLHLLLPITIGKQADLVQIKIDQDNQESEKDDQRLKFSFAVNTANLGNIEVKVKIKQKSVHTLFLTDNSETKKLIKQKLNRLKEKLKEKNYNLSYSDCKLADKNFKNNKMQKLEITSIDLTI
ncbi:Flagellar hook-length control protein FliK [Halobacteroides halobius DSM 5150]|uniref:Flagellar hook-length control protein FliK n=1 Tax=Halobacteroides halobius (strain ATCC 35273 / DSM 5150 / MD-1) TaxID=748449 RepID=L0K8K4_HALHC|nr:flagellar hook-length control protein FliK [Halobacteroides halobius]AGB40865.1 Flagellar hook-length control protein FliK [Halobacteroides halobius DSM 5150]